MLNRPLPAPARDIAMLIARVILGVVLFAHGWQKLMINGISATYGQFEKLGIPLAIVSASFTSFVEFVGGVLIILGALTTTVVALDLIVMVGAAGFVHITNGIFAKDGGWELVGVIVAVELALAAFGPGCYSVDHLIARRRDRERADLDRRRRKPVRRPAAVSEAFTPAADVRAGAVPAGAFGAITPLPNGTPTGGFAAVVPASANAPTGAFAAVAPLAARISTGGSAVGTASASAPTSAFAAVAPMAARVATGGFAAASASAPTGAFAAVTPATPSGSTGAFAVGAPTTPGAAAFVADASTTSGGSTGAFAAAEAPATQTPTTDVLTVVPPAAVAAADRTTVADRDDAEPGRTAEPVGSVAPAPVRAAREPASPRMASAGVHRAMSERAGRSDQEGPAPFGVTVQSPLDFTPTTAMPVVPPMSVETDTITVATSVPGGLPRRVRAADLPPASAVRPYA
jgi:putative oxidoreductase